MQVCCYFWHNFVKFGSKALFVANLSCEIHRKLTPKHLEAVTTACLLAQKIGQFAHGARPAVAQVLMTMPPFPDMYFCASRFPLSVPMTLVLMDKSQSLSSMIPALFTRMSTFRNLVIVFLKTSSNCLEQLTSHGM